MRFLILIKWRDRIHQLHTCLQGWISPKGSGDMTQLHQSLVIMVSQPHIVEVWLRPWFPKGRGWYHLVWWILTKGRKWVWHSLIHSSSISKLVSWDYLWLCPWINIGGRLNDWTNFREYKNLDKCMHAWDDIIWWCIAQEIIEQDNIEPRSVEKYQRRAYWPKWKYAIPIELVSLTKQKKGIWVRSANVPKCKAYWT